MLAREPCPHCFARCRTVRKDVEALFDEAPISLVLHGLVELHGVLPGAVDPLGVVDTYLRGVNMYRREEAE
jgi:hypothetical protein